MKKVLIVLTFLIALFAARSAFAATTADIVITISINAVASLTIDTVTSVAWDLNTSPSSFSSSYISSPYMLKNDGTVNETFKVRGADSIGTHPWTMAAGPGVNQFTVQGLIGDAAATAPLDGEYGVEDTLNNATYVTATTNNLGNNAWNVTSGVDVAPAAQRRLYLRFQTPTGGYASQTSIGTITLTVSADVL